MWHLMNTAYLLQFVKSMILFALTIEFYSKVVMAVSPVLR